MTSHSPPPRLRPDPDEVGFETPTTVANRHSEVYNRLLQDRIVVLGSDVNDEIANFIMAQLLYLE
ncbi:MAG: ATP-dependent Clp protease proteolytic subunit, partial [Acidimicrobiaceae bacterium]|nr:ATP-dependent Clp protease proteolytic subunit [Acidimicrobiaceae bacterium]